MKTKEAALNLALEGEKWLMEASGAPARKSHQRMEPSLAFLRLFRDWRSTNPSQEAIGAFWEKTDWRLEMLRAEVDIGGELAKYEENIILGLAHWLEDDWLTEAMSEKWLDIEHPGPNIESIGASIICEGKIKAWKKFSSMKLEHRGETKTVAEAMTGEFWERHGGLFFSRFPERQPGMSAKDCLEWLFPLEETLSKPPKKNAWRRRSEEGADAKSLMEMAFAEENRHLSERMVLLAMHHRAWGFLAALGSLGKGIEQELLSAAKTEKGSEWIKEMAHWGDVAGLRLLAALGARLSKEDASSAGRELMRSALDHWRDKKSLAPQADEIIARMKKRKEQGKAIRPHSRDQMELSRWLGALDGLAKLKESRELLEALGAVFDLAAFEKENFSDKGLSEEVAEKTRAERAAWNEQWLRSFIEDPSAENQKKLRV